MKPLKKTTSKTLQLTLLQATSTWPIMTMRTIPEAKKIQMTKKKVNLVHHHNLKLTMNHFTGQDWRCPWAMLTVITKHNTRNRHRRKSAKNQEPRNDLQSNKMKFLCKHHHKLGSNMKGLCQLE
eukprot:11310057-Ditylum_brightwellii.AAC.1